jgi:hypothetical protein
MIRKNIQDEINAAFTDRVAKARKILRSDEIMIKDKETKEERQATEHEQLEMVRRIFGQAYTAVQKIVVEQFENGQLGKKNRNMTIQTTIQETAAEMTPEQIVETMTQPSDTTLADVLTELAAAE